MASARRAVLCWHHILLVAASLSFVSSLRLSSSQGQTLLDSHAAPGHPADDPHWFDISPLNAEDAQEIAKEAKDYAEQGKVLEKLQASEEKAEADEAQNEAEKKKKLSDRPTVEIGPEAKAVAMLQRKLGFKLLALDDCKQKLRQCKGKVEETTLGESDATAPKGENRPIEFVKTTAKDDWENEYHRDVPRGNPAMDLVKPGVPIEQEKTTAVQDYVAEQSKYHEESDKHQPGFKHPHDRLFDTDVAHTAKQAKESKRNVDAQLVNQTQKELTLASEKSIEAIKASASVLAADNLVEEKKRAMLRNETLTAISSTETLIADCNTKVKEKCS